MVNRRTTASKPHAVKPPREVSLTDGRRRLGEWLGAWLESRVHGRCADSTYLLTKSVCDRFIVPGLGQVRVRDLSPILVDNWLSSMERQGIGGRTQQVAFATLKQAMRYAVRFEIRTDNPCAAIDAPKARPRRIRPFTREEIQTLLTETIGDWFHCTLVLAFATGMRQGELFGLEWEDVSFADSRLTVRQQAKSVAGRITLGTLKTPWSYRTIQLPDNVIDALREQQRFLEHWFGTKPPAVCPSPKGGLMGRENFRARFWVPLLRRLEIRHRGFHHTRHTYATHALAHGVPITEVAGVLGHSSPATTLSLYAHWLSTDQAKSVAVARELIGSGRDFDWDCASTG